MWMEMQKEILEFSKNEKELQELRKEIEEQIAAMSLDIPKWDMMDDIDIPFTL